MANTISVTKQERGSWGNPQSWFSEVWAVSGTIDDQDAVAATTIGEFDVTVTGVALGDMVVGVVVNKDLDDGTDQAAVSAYVAAADTVTVQVLADNAEFAADDLNGSVIKFLVGRPAW